MANLTAPRADERQEGILNDESVAASTKLFKGSNASYDANGFLKKSSDTASESFAGVILETVDNTGAAGAKWARIWKEGIFEMNCTGAAQNWVGKDVFAVDDNLVALAATTTNDIRVGKVVAFVSSTKVRVKI